MKKNVFLTTAILMGLAASSIPAFADDTETTPNLTDRSILVEGIIGEFDNTQPGPNPEDPNRWINVTIPTTALFYTVGDDHKEIISPVYEIVNNSAKGVRADVAGATSIANADTVKSLSIKHENTEIKLIDDGQAAGETGELMMLTGNSGDNTSGKFTFLGEAAPTNSDVEENPEFTLVLKFSPIVE